MLLSRYIASLLAILVGASTASAQFVDRPGAARISHEGKDFGYFYDSLRWPAEPDGSTIIFVCWEKSVGNEFSNEKSWVQSAVKQSWQGNSRIVFRGWEKCANDNDGIRIVVRDNHPDDGPHVREFGKGLNGVKGGMVLNFTFKTWSTTCAANEGKRKLCIESIAVHEFGHAIGFAHEQDRADTPGECAREHGTGTEDTPDLKLLTPYDPKSVMNYCNPVYNNDGQLSDDDKKSVVAKYGARQ